MILNCCSFKTIAVKNFKIGRTVLKNLKVLKNEDIIIINFPVKFSFSRGSKAGKKIVKCECG